MTLNHPRHVEALDWLVSLAKKWDMAKIRAFWQGKPSYSSANSPFAVGQSAFLITGFWAYEPLDRFARDLHYGVAPLPTPNGTEEEMSRYLIQGWYVSIPKGAKNVNLAWDFIKWAFVEHAAEMGALTLNGPTPLKSFPEFNRMLARQIGPNNRLVPYLDVFNLIAARGSRYFPGTPITMEYYRRVNDAQTQALNGLKAPRQVLDEFNAELQGLLDSRLRAQ